MPTLLIVQVGLLADRIAGDASDCERPETSSTSVVLDTVITTNYDSSDAIDMPRSRDTLDGQRDPRSLLFPNVTPILRAQEDEG